MKNNSNNNLSVSNNVASFLKRNIEAHPDRVAFYYIPKGSNLSLDQKHNAVTYNDFGESVSRLAYGLSELGLRANDRVLVFVPLSVDLYVSLVALQHIGAIPVLLDSLSREAQLQAIVNNSQPSAIIAPGSWLQSTKKKLDAFGIATRITVYKDAQTSEMVSLDDLITTDEKIDIVPVDQNHSALITYTTGSSGTPKGVNRTHGFLAKQHCALKRLFPYSENDVDLPVFPVFALNNIASGITSVIPAVDMSKPNIENQKVILSQIAKCRVNNMTLSPSSFLSLAKYCQEHDILLDGISRVLTGGAPISELDIEQFIQIAPNSQNWILYGSTEVEPISIIESREMLSVGTYQGTNVTKTGVNVGKIDTALKYKFIDIDTENTQENVDVNTLEVGVGEVGELIVTGDHVCQGYYKNQEAFLRSKIKDKAGVVWHRTGDLARQDANGYLWIVGRKHNVIEYNGEYFFPVRPEIILRNLLSVSNAAYVGLKEKDKQKIVAVVTLTDGTKQSEVDIRSEVTSIFEKENLPLDTVVFMSDIPMDIRHHSKVDYKALREKLYEVE